MEPHPEHGEVDGMVPKGRLLSFYSGFRVDGTDPKMSFRWGPYMPPFGDCAIYSQPRLNPLYQKTSIIDSVHGTGIYGSPIDLPKSPPLA